MNVQKEVVENLKQFFQKELRNIDLEIDRNRREINRMTEKQEVLKRSRARLDKLSRELL
jgi:hypothetical protein